MGLLKEVEFGGFLKRGVSNANVLLIHGNDQASVNLFASQITKHFGSESQRLEEGACKASPGLFADAFFSLSLLGDRQLLILDDVDDVALSFLQPAIDATKPANFVLITSGSLSKTSKLRVAVEKAFLCKSLAVYEEVQAAMRDRLRQVLTRANMAWGDDGEEAFYASVGNDRTIVNQELEKLLIYCHGQSVISDQDVNAICGNTAEFSTDDLADAILSGNLESTDHIFTSLEGDLSAFFPLFALHITKLQMLHGDMERGINAEAAFAAAKPPIFFKRKRAILDQLRKLSLTALLDIQQTLQETNLMMRKNASLAEPIASRALLSIARSCR